MEDFMLDHGFIIIKIPKVIMTEEFYNNEGKLNGLRTTYYNNSKIASEVSYKKRT